MSDCDLKSLHAAPTALMSSLIVFSPRASLSSAMWVSPQNGAAGPHVTPRPDGPGIKCLIRFFVYPCQFGSTPRHPHARRARSGNPQRGVTSSGAELVSASLRSTLPQHAASHHSPFLLSLRFRSRLWIIDPSVLAPRSKPGLLR